MALEKLKRPKNEPEDLDLELGEDEMDVDEEPVDSAVSLADASDEELFDEMIARGLDITDFEEYSNGEDAEPAVDEDEEDFMA